MKTMTLKCGFALLILGSMWACEDPEEFDELSLTVENEPLFNKGCFDHQPEKLISFDPLALETPESIVFDRKDNAYITMAFTGEIRKIDTDLNQSTLAYLPIGAPCADPSRFTVALGLAFNKKEELFVAISACDPTHQGIWKVDKDTGAIAHIAKVPDNTVLNGLHARKKFLYAADSFDGYVWRVSEQGGTPEIWADDPLLKVAPGSPFPGPNGLKAYRKKLIVANSSTSDMVAIPIEKDGLAGEARVYATLPDGQGCDEFAIDVLGRIYCTTDPFNTVVRINRNGSSKVLLTAEDGLDGPTSAAFGRRGWNRFNLYITNAAFPMFTTTFQPSLMRLRVFIPGAK